MKKASLQIKLGGQTHQIDANTLINILIHHTAIVSEINNELGGGNRDVKVKVNALKEGSFIIDLEVEESLKTIFSNDTAQYLAAVVTVFGGVIGVYKKLKGKPITDSNKGDITINNTTINIYNDRKVREAISKSFETADADNSVEHIEFAAKGFETIEIPKEDFRNLIYTDFDEEEIRPQEIDEYVDAAITITGMKFERGGMWTFIYNGFPIKMVVKDDALMKAIDNGARFGKGDAIKVKLKIIKQYNEEYKTYINKSYRIMEYYEHIQNITPTQQKLF